MRNVQSQSPFLTSLPPEIRLLIYHVCITDFLDSQESHDKLPRMTFNGEQISTVDWRGLCPPLLLTCKMVAQEIATPMSQHGVVLFNHCDRWLGNSDDDSAYHGVMPANIEVFFAGPLRRQMVRSLRMKWVLLPSSNSLGDFRISPQQLIEEVAPVVERVEARLHVEPFVREGVVLTGKGRLLDQVEGDIESVIRFCNCASSRLCNLVLDGPFTKVWLDSVEKRLKKTTVSRGNPIPIRSLQCEKMRRDLEEVDLMDEPYAPGSNLDELIEVF